MNKQTGEEATESFCLLPSKKSEVNHALSDALALEYARAYAKPKAIKKKGGVSVILFRIGPEWLGIASGLVQKVMSPRGVRFIPHRTNSTLQGVANYDGEMLVVVSVRDLLGIEVFSQAATGEEGQCARTDAISHAYARSLMISKEGRPIAIPVDEVYGRKAYHADDLRTPPATIRNAMKTYVKGLVELAGMQVGILDGDLLLYKLEQLLK